ncbi:prolyl oligopeptidase family serine peptidase [Alteriqipengyuania flavescens]|uniref:alpha/beta hydrolase family protein n=1 Tax=Alteriqipengyuania flavescens TaxID=3053610 RepID=UPI0025B45052|nr:prolyl oligopeptidase family serine peptidase [Alteriqipengyuania flavescens]WJY18000.1 prolyl oligopeptidase family serine peptidase [Alteriqipengyuania flavescens]WJY23941.1 prolyl oligopeptidase family serine peptidase [Alteriqipengyuania flavescens]
MNRLLTAALGAMAVAVSTSALAQALPDAPPISAYGELPALQDAALSPSGRIAMLATVNGDRVVLMLDPKLKPLNMIKVGDIKVRGIDWAGDDMVLVTRTDTQELGDRYIASQAEFANIMIVPVDPGKPVRTVFADEREIMNAVQGNYGVRQIGGKWYGFYGGSPMERNQAGTYYYNGAPLTLYRVDLESGATRRVDAGRTRSEGRRYLIDGRGDVSVTMDYEYATDRWSLKNASGTELASGTTPDGSAGLTAFTQDGTGVIYSTYIDDDVETMKYYAVPLTGGTPQEMFAGEDIEAFYRNPWDGRIVGYRTENNDRKPVFFDEAWETEVRNIYQGFDAQNGSIAQWTPDLSKVLVTTGGNADSGTWYLLDTVAKGAQVIGRERPQIGPRFVGAVSTYEYTAADGLELEGILTLPPGIEAKNLPVVMLPHGGPASHDYEQFDWWAQALASRGYAVFQPNFRGSTNRDKAFVDAGNGEWGRKMQTDITDGMMALAADGIVDPERACIVGASYGGYAALAGVTVEQGVYRCAVAVAGVSDLASMVDQERRETGSKELVEYWIEKMGPKDELDSISPRKLAAQADAPIMLIHGRDDTVVPYRQSTIMADALRSAGKPYELVELDGEDHWLSLSATRLKMLEETVRFVEKHNPAD